MAAVNINRNQFEELIKGEAPVLVEFWAPWCVYCRRISVAYDKIAEQYDGKLNVVKVNIDDEAELSDAEQIEIVPTLVLYRGGAAIGSIVAPESKAMIDNFIKENLD